MSKTSKHRSGTRSPAVVLSLILAGIVIAGSLFVAVSRYRVAHTEPVTDGESLIVRSIGPTDHVLGDVSAPIQLVVYADLSCKYCKSFFDDTYPALKKKYGDRIVLAYRHLPLASHPSSRLEARVAECVAGQGGTDAFWKFVRSVYAQPSYEDGLTLAQLLSLAERIGVPRDMVDSCVRTELVDRRVDGDALEASIAGLNQTPSIVLKSATRALIVAGNQYSKLDTGIEYLGAEIRSSR